MLIGQAGSRIDEKNRISFPKKYREELGDSLIVTQGFESSLIVVSVKRWKSLLEGTEGIPFTNKEARETQRFLLGSAEEVTLDEKGRFVLQQHLKDYAKIDKEVICLGISRYVEIWDKKRWEEHNNELIQNIEPITKKLSENPPSREASEGQRK